MTLLNELSHNHSTTFYFDVSLDIGGLGVYLMVENSGVRTLLIYLDKNMGDQWYLVPIGLGRVTSTYKVRNSNLTGSQSF